MQARTLNEIFLRSVEQHAAKPALLAKREGEYAPLSYADLHAQVLDFAAGLSQFGVGRGTVVGLLSENRPEWVITDLGALMLGGVNTPMFPALPAPQIAYILADGGAKVVVVSTDEQLEKVRQIRGDVPSLELVIVMDEVGCGPGEKAFSEVVTGGRDAGEAVRRGIIEAGAAIGSDDVASLIYTSGTTGGPKGVMLTHGNFASNVSASHEVLKMTTEDVLLSSLPLSHVFERTAGYYVPLSAGATIAYAESLRSVGRNMLEVRPTIMCAVPRQYEQMCAQMARRSGSGGARRAQPSDLLGGRLRFFISGGAALPKSVAESFQAMGITILEGYGLTESSPVISVNREGAVKLGTVGPPLPGVEVKIAEDGEILTRGGHVMKGYHGLEAETRAAIDAEGWLHTGDIGHLDEDGYLVITDRKKNLLVLANGKNVAPQPIENQLKLSPFIQEVMLVGDGQKAVSALVVPAYDRVRAHLDLDVNDQELAENDAARALIKTEVDRLSADLAEFEKVKRLALLPAPFSMEAGELTPTLKLKRKVVTQKYAHIIDQL